MTIVFVVLLLQTRHLRHGDDLRGLARDGEVNKGK